MHDMNNITFSVWYVWIINCHFQKLTKVWIHISALVNVLVAGFCRGGSSHNCKVCCMLLSGMCKAREWLYAELLGFCQHMPKFKQYLHVWKPSKISQLAHYKLLGLSHAAVWLVNKLCLKKGGFGMLNSPLNSCACAQVHTYAPLPKHTHTHTLLTGICSMENWTNWTAQADTHFILP
jgi:hypothetical protein